MIGQESYPLLLQTTMQWVLQPGEMYSPSDLTLKMTSAQIFKILVTTGFFYLSLDCMGNQNYPWVQTD